MRPEGAPHTAPSRGIACVLAAPPPAHTGGIASSEERGFPPHIHAPNRSVRRVEAAVAYKRIKRVAATPAAQKDVLTWLTPQPRHGGKSNKFPIYHSDKLTYGTM